MADSKELSKQTRASYAMNIPITRNRFEPLRPSSSKPINSQLVTPNSFLLPGPSNYLQALQVQPPKSPASITSRPALNLIGTLPTRPSETKQNNQGPLTKPFVKSVSYIEPEHGTELKTIILNMFPKDFLFFPDTLEKTRIFYEFILVDTDSVEITHVENPKYPGKYSYSKCKILKVLTLSDWNSDPFTERTLSQPFIPQVFNYQDYQKAWQFAFLYSNYHHSWFFHFHNDIPRKFPHWFYQWWKYFGASELVHPTIVKEGYEIFQQKYSSQTIPKLMTFNLMFKIPWIIYWDFDIVDRNAAEPPLLTRRWKVKWWKAFPEEQACKNTVLQKLAGTTISNPTPQQPSIFLSSKSRLQANLADVSSQEDYKRKLK